MQKDKDFPTHALRMTALCSFPDISAGDTVQFLSPAKTNWTGTLW